MQNDRPLRTRLLLLHVVNGTSDVTLRAILLVVIVIDSTDEDGSNLVEQN